MKSVLKFDAAFMITCNLSVPRRPSKGIDTF